MTESKPTVIGLDSTSKQLQSKSGSSQKSVVMGNFISRCLVKFGKLFASHPTQSNPELVVSTNIDRDSQLKAIRAKIRSLEEADIKQIHILDYIKSDSFKDRVSNKILSMARGSLDEKLGGKQDEDQESRIKKLREEREILLEEDKRVQCELQKAEQESARLREVLRQKHLDLQELRGRVLQKRGVKATLEEKNCKDIYLSP